MPSMTPGESPGLGLEPPVVVPLVVSTSWNTISKSVKRHKKHINFTVFTLFFLIPFRKVNNYIWSRVHKVKEKFYQNMKRSGLKSF